MGRLKQSTEKIQELLDKVESGEVAPDWNASEGESGYIENKIGGDIHLNPLGNNFWINEEGDRVYQTYYEVYYSRCNNDAYGGGYRWFKIPYTERLEYLPDACYGTEEWTSNYSFRYRFPTAQEIENDYRCEGAIIIRNEYEQDWNLLNEILYCGFNEAGVENPIREWFISSEIARQDSVDELREETTSLWENLDHGTFPDLVAGDLAGRGESVPAEFGFRASGGKSIKDGRAYIKRIKGNSVVWNNMVDTRGYENGFFIIEGVKILQGHKYLLQRSAANASLYLIPVINGVEKYEMSILAGEYAKIFVSQYTDTTDARVYAEEYCGACVITDLTQMFQAGNEPTTIEEFNARVATLGIDMYAYNEGQVIHCNTESIKSVGDNAWDEEWEVGGIHLVTGENEELTYRIRSKNYIKILPNTQYYFRKPAGVFLLPFYYDENKNFIAADDVLFTDMEGNTFTTLNASYMRFYCDQPTYNNDIMLTLVHSGWKVDTDAGYQPYWQDILPLPIIRNYFPDGMKLAGSAHDEIRFNKASGKWEYSKGKIKSVDMGTLYWELDGGTFYTVDERYFAKMGLLSSRYTNITSKDESMNMYAVNGILRAFNSAYTDAASFKASLQGVMLYYESNDWEWVELDEADQNFRDYYNVADFGTEMSQSNVPSAPFSADIIYQFNAVDMIREHEAEITELQRIIATMQAQLTSLINGGQ